MKLKKNVGEMLLAHVFLLIQRTRARFGIPSACFTIVKIT